VNARERYLATLAFEKLDRPPFYECAYWSGLIARWYSEGLPHLSKEPADAADVTRELGLDEPLHFIPLRTRYAWPPFEEAVLEDHDTWVLLRNESGSVVRRMKQGNMIPSFVRGAVETREDWEQIKERFRPSLEGRVPDDWDQQVVAWRTRDYPLLGTQSEPWLNLIELFGPERLLMLFHDDPQWLKAMIHDLCDFFIGLTDLVLQQIRPVPEICLVGGDFCYKAGPLMSPAAFREFLFPEFKRVIDVYHSYGVHNVMLHTDGDFRPLIPLLLEAGVTGVHPFEVTNGQSIVEVRKAYPRLQIFGGINKQALERGKEDIDAELARLQIPWMVSQGGWIPYVDHAVPPDVSWANFSYYRRRLNALATIQPQ
jgi:hypothetical protein